MNKEEIKRAYLRNDFDPVIENLEKVISICDQFKKSGGDRLQYAFEVKSWNLEQVNKLLELIMDARQKMEKELARIKKFETDFISTFATDYNGYFNNVEIVLTRMRSHTSPLKTILKKTCSSKKPRNFELELFNIEPKPVVDASVLATPEYQTSCIDIDDPSIPSPIRDLYHELISFFENQKEAFVICMRILKQVEEVKRDPIKSKYYLDNYRQKTWARIKNTVMLISEDTIEMLIKINPIYQRYQTRSSEEAFAQSEYHNVNTAEMDHFCLIEKLVAQKKYGLEKDEIANWGNRPELVKKIKYVSNHFDEVLPSNFGQKSMGKYQYYFCKWALPGNIKACNKYFCKHYHGKWRPSGYAAVNSHSTDYVKRENEISNFREAIKGLLERANMPDIAEISA